MKFKLVKFYLLGLSEQEAKTQENVLQNNVNNDKMILHTYEVQKHQSNEDISWSIPATILINKQQQFQLVDEQITD